jgi:LysR family glycine cleavage system transcriptional activator
MRMPPLNALRAFEAAARYQNFSRAAEELHVTQGAVSRHVKLLERHLGIELFRRRPQGLELTGPGRALLPELSASFERITQAAKAVANQDHEIRVFSVAPTIVTRWLVPHLMGFQERYPEYRVNIGLAHGNYDGFYKGSFDIGLDCFEGAKTRPGGFDSILFRREALTPVCSPRLLDGERPLEKPLDLANHVLLHPDVDFYEWRKWLRAADLTEVDVESGQTFESMEMAVRAAVGGFGVTIADLLLVQDELESGQLIAPFDLVVSEDTGYYLFCGRGRFQEPKIAAFRDWIIAEAEASEQGVPAGSP